jgi:acetyl-CoA synthetase
MLFVLILIFVVLSKRNYYKMTPRINSFAEYKIAYQKSVEHPEAFWNDIAETFTWRKKWDSVLQWDFKKPEVKWFVNGKLNITENVLDRHLAERANQTAIIWEGNKPDEATRKLTYGELHEQVCKFANVLLSLGIEKGDRVCIYMPMIPELAIAILATARIGAVHSVVFAGFSSRALADRILDANAKIVITADGFFRGEKNVALKDIADEALKECVDVKNVVVYQRTSQNIQWNAERIYGGMN